MLNPTASKFILIGFAFLLGWYGSSAREAELKLRGHLSSKYSKDIRPVLNESDAVVVYLGMELNQLLNIDEKDQFFEVSGWLIQKWKDTTLNWNASNYNSIQKITIDAEKIWRPNIILHLHKNDGVTEHEGYLNKMTSEVTLRCDGLIECASRSSFRVGCNINVIHFPYDTQTCNISFKTRFNGASGITLKDGNASITQWFHTNMNWEFIAHLKQSHGDVSHSQVDFSFTFHRKSIYFIKLLIISIALVTALMTLTFLLPHESGERMGVALTLMLSGLVFIMLVAQTMPLNHSKGRPRLTIFFTTCLLLMGFMITSLCLISRVFYWRKEDSSMPAWVRRIFVDKLSYIICVRVKKDGQFKMELGEDGLGKNDSQSQMESGEEEPRSDWQIVAIILSCFILYLVVTITVFISCLSMYKDQINYTS